jgi:hypothetical protein
VLQFRWFNKYEIQADEFFLRLRFFLQRLKDLPTIRFVVEIRNKALLDKRLTDLLREYNVALALKPSTGSGRPEPPSSSKQNGGYRRCVRVGLLAERNVSLSNQQHSLVIRQP